MSYAIPSSGDPEEDQRQLAEFARSDALISAGQCPNGCGPLVPDGPNTQTCAGCGFINQRFVVGPQFFGLED